ncbi:MAG TPA: SRPBCC family protein, partial [Anaerolineaceae bacterium]|nr:SRPBCC family protein [Anaerolineaceae bacterium]
METQTKSGLTINTEKKEIRGTRIFNAPRELVFKVMTDPKLIPEWWGPRRLTTTVDQMDVRVGGIWRYVQRDGEGHEFAFNGVYREVVPPGRLVYTFEFEEIRGHEIVETLIFEADGDKTRMTDIMIFQTLEDLEGMVQSGMEE